MHPFRLFLFVLLFIIFSLLFVNVIKPMVLYLFTCLIVSAFLTFADYFAKVTFEGIIAVLD